MDLIEKILGPGKDEQYGVSCVPNLFRGQAVDRSMYFNGWDSKVFYRKGKGPRKCLIGCRGTEIWIWVGANGEEDYRFDLKDPNSINIIKEIMKVK